MPDGADQRHRVVGRPLLVGADQVALRAGGLVGERVAAPAAHSAQSVEDGIDRARDPDPRAGPGHVHPPGAHPVHRGGGWRRVGHEVEPPHDVHGVGASDEVVDHVVDEPVVRRSRAPAESLRHLQDRLLLAGGELRVAVHDPHRMVEVEHVHPRNRAVEVDELGVEPRDVPGLLREELGGVQPDDVLPGLHGHRAVAVAQMLDAVIVDMRNRVRLVLDRSDTRRRRRSATRSTAPPPRIEALFPRPSVQGLPASCSRQKRALREGAVPPYRTSMRYPTHGQPTTAIVCRSSWERARTSFAAAQCPCELSASARTDRTGWCRSSPSGCCRSRPCRRS